VRSKTPQAPPRASLPRGRSLYLRGRPGKDVAYCCAGLQPGVLADSGQFLINELIVHVDFKFPIIRLIRAWVVKSCCILLQTTDSRLPCPEANLANPDELVIFMTLPVGVDELIIPGVLASRDIPVHLTERYFARQGRYVEIRVPASRLEDARRALDDAKRVGENLDSGTEV